MKLNSTQKIAIFGLTGVLTALILALVCYYQIPFQAPRPSTSAHLFFALKWGAIPVIMLILPIQVIAITRFGGTNINPAGMENSTEPLALRIRERFLQNTLEQFVIFYPLLLALAIALPHHAIKLIPIFVILFTLARICFLIGYRLANEKNDCAHKRAFGMAINLVLNWVMLAILLTTFL